MMTEGVQYGMPRLNEPAPDSVQTGFSVKKNLWPKHSPQTASHLALSWATVEVLLCGSAQGQSSCVY